MRERERERVNVEKRGVREGEREREGGRERGGERERNRDREREKTLNSINRAEKISQKEKYTVVHRNTCCDEKNRFIKSHVRNKMNRTKRHLNS